MLKRGAGAPLFGVFELNSTILTVAAAENGLLRATLQGLEFIRILAICTYGDKKGYIMGENVTLSLYKSGKWYG